ncbi:magnesium transporter [Haliangium ochraceum]|uniref:Magnesium transporter MgtE n=1 Tax=Haliangium ochraceum (strain DSM 14365 / JCM 11303 / SMP-2) TaxID=502025 RepID=D0LUI5_HALO1|nr:magnesium transporter [Haliangium ochraceum]ACY19308.1 magnesium transporter [Haliangium ochraceum DSM 14365]
MDTTTRLLLPEVTEALHSHPQELVALTEELHPADLADLARALEPELGHRLLAVLPVGIGARLLEACDEDHRLALFQSLAESEMAHAVAVTDEMAADDRADLYALLPSSLRAKLLAALDVEESRDIRQLLSYREESAGALLTTDFVALPASTTVAEAIDMVRESAAEMETIYIAYAVDPNGTLLGAVSLRDLVTSPLDRTIDAIMNPNIVSVKVDDDQENAARLLARYDLLAMPVVDEHHRILGIITVDDLMDVVEEEATEDAQKMGAVEPLHTPYATSSLGEIIQARAPWLVALFVAVLATENVLEHYAHSGMVSAAMLMWFVPLIISSGGNSGSQSATLIIRAMAVERLGARDTVMVLSREAIIGLILGVLVALVGVVRVLLTESTRSFEMAAAIGLSIASVVAVGALVGTGVPMLLRRLGIDPAVASTPFIASVLDIAGLIIYFEIADLFLP